MPACMPQPSAPASHAKLKAGRRLLYKSWRLCLSSFSTSLFCFALQEGKTPLHVAATWAGDVRSLKTLLAAGTDKDAKDKVRRAHDVM